MKHLRTDYDAIQPWPVKRPHHGIVREENGQGEEVQAKHYDLSSDSLVQLGGESGVQPIIPDDEPVFLLRAKDKNAAQTVREWAARTYAAGNDRNLYVRVLQFADEMERYADSNYNGGKVADVPEGMLR